MKFLPEERKKRFWSVAILLIAVGGTIYVQFFSGPAKNLRPKDTVYPPAVQPGSPAPPTAAGPASLPSAAGSAPRSTLLPYGNTINTALFAQDKFKALKPAPPLSVRREELGVENLFGR